MGRGGGGRGKGGGGAGRNNKERSWESSQKPGKPAVAAENGWAADWSTPSHKSLAQAHAAQAWAGADLSWGIVPQGQFPRPLASQWRFFCRVLHRHAPEERIHDWRRQLRLGDHVFTYYAWDFSEQHGIISSLGEDGYGRRGGRDSEPWVVYWSGSRLHCTSLLQFSKGGELFRVTYPHWACQCHVPISAVVKPHVAHERRLEPDSDDVVADKAHQAYNNGDFHPHWTQAVDLEFCIRTKTGKCPKWELHGRKAISAGVLPAIGCAIKGEQSPTKLFGNPDASSNSSYVTPPPGYMQQWEAPAVNMGAPQPAAATEAPPPAPVPVASATVEAPAMSNSWAPMPEQWFSGGWCPQSGQPVPCSNAPAPGWQGACMGGAPEYAPPNQAGDASSRVVSNPTTALSADAAAFVPRNWDGIYQ
mmetsp:Transcript_55991/g.133419  ORF Transcript_55991/g.133419 Transcript_55991/m.133419 type:complete len:418 (+) Transcript_55991:83-1336(+)